LSKDETIDLAGFVGHNTLFESPEVNKEYQINVFGPNMKIAEALDSIITSSNRERITKINNRNSPESPVQTICITIKITINLSFS